MKNNRKLGFTLVEIMIVVLIIGILLAIALPNFIEARASSRLHAIQENLQKIEIAKERWGMDNQKLGTDVPLLTDLVPNYLTPAVAGPVAGTYSPNSLNTFPTFNGRDRSQWQSACVPDSTAAGCGL